MAQFSECFQFKLPDDDSEVILQTSFIKFHCSCFWEVCN